MVENVQNYRQCFEFSIAGSWIKVVRQPFGVNSKSEMMNAVKAIEIYMVCGKSRKPKLEFQNYPSQIERSEFAILQFFRKIHFWRTLFKKTLLVMDKFLVI